MVQLNLPQEKTTNIKFTPIIGLEVHVELKTASKMFCGCDARHFNIAPNTHTCPVCLALPGALPVPNGKAIEWTMMIGLALGCEVNDFSYFERKNYFYPDLPKGYQISQYERPFTINGKLKIKYQKLNTKNTNKILKTIRINRVHLEEDTAKLKHETIMGKKYSLIDFNRSGVPLVEIVTEPDFSSSEEAIIYLKKLQKIIRYLGVSDCDMEKGSMRLEPTVNLEIAKDGKKYYTPLTELKNINSFRFARKAIEYEIKRQYKNFVEKGISKDKYPKETRGYNEDRQATVPQREKEEANDYRYFPEPDIPPFNKLKAKSLKLKARLPELPDVKCERFVKQYGLKEDQAQILTENRQEADFFEECIRLGKKENIDAVKIANLLQNRIKSAKKDQKSADKTEGARNLIEAIKKETEDLVGDEAKLKEIAAKIINKVPGQVKEFKAGKTQLMGYFMGQMMQATKGRADPKKAREILQKIISNK